MLFMGEKTMRKILGVLLIGLLSLGLFAGDNKRVVESAAAHKNTQTLLTAVTWHATVDAALEQAKKDGKLVLWIQLKGKLDSFV
jgi:hypothetical protein